MLGPKHTVESVAQDLIKGLEDGSIVLDKDKENATPQDAPKNADESLVPPKESEKVGWKLWRLFGKK